jgi:hypothetical protein
MGGSSSPRTVSSCDGASANNGLRPVVDFADGVSQPEHPTRPELMSKAAHATPKKRDDKIRDDEVISEGMKYPVETRESNNIK